MLIIIRHGRTAANAAGLLQGMVDNVLDELGRRQADEIAAAVGEVDAIVSSPLARAVETAGPLAARSGVGIEIDERWIELDYGQWEARPVADVPAATWDRWRTDPHFRPPGGESLFELNERVSQACEDLLERARHGTVAVVTHVSPIKAAVAWALGVHDEISWRMRVDQAQISRVAVRGDRPSLVSFNDVAHLSS